MLALAGLIIIIIACMLSNFIGPLWWSLAVGVGCGLLFKGLDAYVKKHTNPD